MKESMVAMSGAIMPEPLAIPFSVTGTLPTSARRVASFGKVSVVMIARAASAHRSSRARGAISFSTALNFEASSGSPMTPVDAMNTRSGSHPAASAAKAAVASTVSRPRHPVKAFALPELTTRARPLPC